ncbi:hypothetical protein FHX42_002231 [Saccharopolyspora lacisalsi]|uniref:Uncharacterized protein n=1 Tax=Halosaccharopolyspora lacisalsi TaxID=1000566 RepID=A0A839DTR5_9PSEU|nr:hypothetical protein [Halosaccharopolyspora lacisalsi]MBA8824884.1 hypothetical protein [Halosaccharopolyspora lacisalsi]
MVALTDPGGRGFELIGQLRQIQLRRVPQEGTGLAEEMVPNPVNDLGGDRLIVAGQPGQVYDLKPILVSRRPTPDEPFRVILTEDIAQRTDQLGFSSGVFSSCPLPTTASE